VSTPRILVADDHPQVLASLCRLLEAAGVVVGAVEDGRTAVAEALRLRPNVVVLDVMMPGMSGLDAAKMLRRDAPEIKVILCTVNVEPGMVDEAFAAGAVGFVRKQSAYADLAPAIRAAMAGETFVSRAARRP